MAANAGHVTGIRRLKYSGGAPDAHGGKIDVRLEHLVDIVGERVEGHMGDDLDQFRIGVARGPCSTQIGLGHSTPLADNLDSETQGRFGLGIA